MKHLQDYIFESTAKFDHAVNKIEELFELDIPFTKYISDKLKIKDNFIKFINNILNNYKGVNIDNKIIYTEGNETKIKMPYAYKETIENEVKNNELYSISVISNNKIYIKHKQSGKIIMETGSGSLKTVNTRDQEVASCLVWNNFVESLKGTDNIKYTKEQINDIMKDIMESSISFNDEWANSFTQQILCIKSYISKITDNKDAFLNYRCERYGGDQSFKYDESNPDSGWYISKKYEEFISKYVSFIGGKKDNYDPTDIIIYNINKKNEIIETLNALINIGKKDIIEAKQKFIQIFYGSNDYVKYNDNDSFVKEYKQKLGENVLIGLSLKKISTEKGSYQIFNIAKSISPNKVNEIIKADKIEKNGKIVVSGHFIFAEENDGSSKSEEETSNYCMLTYRSFGKTIGMDVQMCDKEGRQNGPALGKVPVRDWKNRIFKDSLNIESPKNLEEGRKLLAKYIKETSKNKQIEDLTFLIREAIKVGPNCFPFVLIH